MFNLSTVCNIKSSLASLALAAGLCASSLSVQAACVSADGGVQTQTLYAGQTIEAGTVSVEVVDTNLVVTYETTGGWELQETHTWVGQDIADMPQTRKGTPKIGNFPYASDDITGLTTHSEAIPLTDLEFSCPGDEKAYFVAAHAAVQLNDGAGNVIQTETGWADGDRFVEKGMWGTFFTVTLTCDCGVVPPVVGGSCETAFAWSGGTNAADGDITNSFLDIDEDGDMAGDFNRWGWSNGAIPAGNYTWDIYAGAGRSDITKGTHVGYLTVDYDGANATVTYTMNSPYYMEENHLYVGTEILPRDVNNDYTVAPGQYPTIHDGGHFAGDSVNDFYMIDGLSGNIHVVAHATVCGF